MHFNTPEQATPVGRASLRWRRRSQQAAIEEVLMLLKTELLAPVLIGLEAQTILEDGKTGLNRANC